MEGSVAVRDWEVETHRQHFETTLVRGETIY